MEDKIKEILECLSLIARNEYVPDELLNDEMCQQLLDYITNLQEEIHKKEAMYDSLAVDYRLSQEENEKVHKDFDELSERYFFTKSRNEQAIRYIERCRDYHRDIHKEERIFPDEITSLLMILKIIEKDKQLDKYKNVIDKIKEYCKEETIDNREYRGVAYRDALNNILELLEEIND